MASVRGLGPADHRAAGELFTAVYPLRANEVGGWTDAGRYVAIDADRVIAYAALWPFQSDGHRMDLVVAPDQRRRGAGSRLLELLAGAARAAGSITLQARVDDTWRESLAFLGNRGFAETMLMHRQVLDVADATLEPFDHIENTLRTSGIVIKPLPADSLAEFGDVMRAAAEGWPDPDPRPVREPLTDAELEPRTPDCFVAVHGDRYVGFTGPFAGTGVRPEYRGRGIATALKVRAVRLARSRGVVAMATSSGNPAMLSVNERLGFRRTTTEVRLVRRL
ncbi:hypothetical protein Lesp02_07440 [Lentzea sp. NBRC 105346]|uniref:GNAT family N-acetyltransferase n=1 Tax=Lentzea sp. NBRC 105346 TaxID=3032205 RepID=UPI0024A4DE86|nr:GNAT family N-acetyltransferase [Lentzea sp. NBRC 105346]GLZ28554.1 hypothetical protein Lesp02_07440 [Lentzea sp. NBRC 105346]